jgi:hypothetical protein
MLGVVLWSDAEDQKAVIWCEDHGDLAFYSTTETALSSDVGFDAGDLVQFDVTMDRHLRYAHNPRLVSEGVYPSLADTLVSESAAPRRRNSSADILPFELRKPAGATARSGTQGIKSAG